MTKHNLSYFIAIILIVFVVGTVIGQAQTPTTTTYLNPGSLTGTADYIIFKDGENYFAKNGTTGQIQFSSTNATYVIQSALDVGNSVYVSKGTYYINVTNTAYEAISIGSNQAIIGSGMDSTIFMASGNRATGVGGAGFLIFLLHDNSMIRDCTINMNGDNLAMGSPGVPQGYGAIVFGESSNHATGAIAERVKVINATAPHVNIYSYGFNTFYGDGVTIRDVQVYSCHWGAVLTYPTTATRTHDHLIDGLYGEDCGRLVWWEFGAGVVTNIRGKNCTVGVQIQGSATDHTEGVLSNVKLYNMSSYGIIGENVAGYDDHFTISDVYIESTMAEHAIWLVGTNSSYVLNNIIITDTAKVGIEVTAKEVVINGGMVEDCGQHGIQIQTAANATITNMVIKNNGRNATHSGLALANCPNGGIVANNRIFNDKGSFQQYGIASVGTSDNFTIVANDLRYNIAPMIIAGSNNIVEANMGFVTENSGYAVIATGASISHGLAAAPTSIVITAGAAGLSGLYVSNINVNTFDINFAGGGGSDVIHWYAEYKP